MMIYSCVTDFCNAVIKSLLVECVTFPALAKMTELVKLFREEVGSHIKLPQTISTDFKVWDSIVL